MGYGEREWRDLMFDMSGLKIEGIMGEFISTPFEKRERLHAAHHYTLGRLIDYRLGAMERKFGFQHSLITPLGQHMIQIMVRSVPRACSYC